MVLKSSLFVDAFTNADKGKKNLLGVFHEINTSNYPIIFQFAIYLQFMGEVSDKRDHKVYIQVFDDELREVGRSDSILLHASKVQINSISKQFIIDLVSNVQGLVIPRPGLYEFRIIVEDRHAGTMVLPANELKK